MEKPREEEAEVELGVGRPIGTAGEVQKLVRNEPSQSSGRLVSMEFSEEYVTGVGQVLVPVAAVGATFA